MRDPAIHIRRSDLMTILTSLGVSNAKVLASSICSAAIPYSIKNRSIITGNKQVRDKATKAVNAARESDMTVERFNLLLDAQRRAAGHKHLSPIRRNTPQFTLLQEVAQQAADFCANVGIASIDEGCKVYIQIGLEKMKRGSQYALSKFKYYDEQIYKAYESYDMVHNDPDKETTKLFCNTYAELLAEYAGVERDLKRVEDYVNFVYARLEATSVNADMDDWIRAQFEELGRAYDAVPNPNQLFGDNALYRYYKYIGKPKKESEIRIIANAPNVADDFEAKYRQKLREKYGE